MNMCVSVSDREREREMATSNATYQHMITHIAVSEGDPQRESINGGYSVFILIG